MEQNNDHMTPYAALNTALVAALSETKDIHPDSTNPFHKNKYASLAAHLAAIKPVFAKHGLAILQLPESENGSVGVRTTILHKDGGQISTYVGIPANADTSGQDAGTIISYLRRYALAAAAGVATEDDDGESDRAARASQSVKTTKFIPNPSAKPAYTGKGGDTQFIVPFGDCKGQALSALPMKSNDKSKKCGDLYYWANVWTPKPFGDNPEPSPKDVALKAEAQRLYAVAEAGSALVAEEANSDDVPF
jgi:hypothetical protein